MSWKNDSGAQRFTFLFLLTCCIILICVTASPTFGQSIWSDVWLVTPPPDNNALDDPDEIPTIIPGAYINGCGVTEDYYNSYGHEYSVDTTLSSSLGRTAWGGGGGGAYARADASLPMRSDEGEDFTIESIHHTFCPIRGMDLMDNATFAQIGVSPGLSAYVFAGVVDPGVCLWQPFPCTAGCSSEHATNRFNGVCFTQGRVYKQCLDAYAYGFCLSRRVVCAGRVQPGFCLG